MPQNASTPSTTNAFSTHNWDYATSVAICTACLVDANNPGHKIPCTGSPMDWPASGSTSYPNCSCGMNDWQIFNTRAFGCNQCQQQYTLPQLQALAPMGRAALRKPTPLPVQIPIGAGIWNIWSTPKTIPLLDDEDLAVPVEKPAPTYERCTSCNRELSKEMDAYYGKDAWQAKKCRPCRTGKPF